MDYGLTMRIALLGTSDFAVPSLQALIDSRHDVVLCVTRPDRPQGRGLETGPSPVALAARARRLTLLQPEQPSAADSVAAIAAARPDLLVVIAYGCILRRTLLAVAPHGAVSLHPSLLPAHRGAAPIAWAILNDDRTTGVSIFRLVEAVDAGDLITQESTAIDPNETAVELSTRLAARGAQLLRESIDLLAAGRVSYRPQPAAHGAYARKLRKEDGRIDWQAPAEGVHNVIRAVQPWPGAHAWWRGTRVTIWRSRRETARQQAPPGTVVAIDRDGILVATGGHGGVWVQELQPASGRRMTAEAFLRGHPLRLGDRLTEHS